MKHMLLLLSLIMSLCGFVGVNAVAEEAKRGLWNPLELELEVFVSCLTRVTETELRSSGSIACTLNHSHQFLHA